MSENENVNRLIVLPKVTEEVVLRSQRKLVARPRIMENKVDIGI